MKKFAGCAVILFASSAVWAAPLTISDFSFENHSVGGSNFQYSSDPLFATYVPGWTFSAGTGITASGSAFQPPAPPDGNQAGLLQGNGSTISQSITGFDSSMSYVLDIWVGTRFGGGCCTGNAGVNFLIDGVQIGTTNILPNASPFALYQIPFTVAVSGAHTLALVNVSGVGDNTSFVDDVSIASTGAPEPATFGLLGGALLALGLVRRRA